MGLWRLAPHSRIFHLYRGGVIRDNLDVKYNRIDGVMVSVLASNMVDRRFEFGRVKPKTMKFVFAVSR